MSDEARPPRDLSHLWLGAAVVGILIGAGLYAADQHDAANVAWAITTAIGVIPMAKDVIGGLIRREPGVDLIALIAMVCRARCSASTWPAP